MIDIAIPHFNSEAEKTVTTRPALQPAARHTSFAQSKSKVPQHEDDDELRVDEDTASEGSDDEAEEEKEEDGKDEFFDTPDIADGVSLKFPFLSVNGRILTRIPINRSKTFIRRLLNSPFQSTVFKLRSSAPTWIPPNLIVFSRIPSWKVSSSNSVYDLTI